MKRLIIIVVAVFNLLALVITSTMLSDIRSEKATVQSEIQERSDQIEKVGDEIQKAMLQVNFSSVLTGMVRLQYDASVLQMAGITYHNHLDNLVNAGYDEANTQEHDSLKTLLAAIAPAYQQDFPSAEYEGREFTASLMKRGDARLDRVQQERTALVNRKSELEAQESGINSFLVFIQFLTLIIVLTKDLLGEKKSVQRIPSPEEGRVRVG